MLKRFCCAIWTNRRYWRSVLPSLIFNFKYLPFQQARRLPIIVYRCNGLWNSGTIRIEGMVKPGMIRLGINRVPLYPDNGIKLRIEGTMIFKGACNIGNNSVLSVGKTGTLELGDGFSASCALKIACHAHTVFGDNVRVGWDCMFSDSDFHATKTAGVKSEGVQPILIGANNWFAMQSLVLKGAKTAPYTIIAARTVLTKDYTELGSKVLIGGSPVRVLRYNTYRDLEDDILDQGNNG